jgi:hypothetical protein
MGRDMHYTNKSILTMPRPKEISQRIKNPSNCWVHLNAQFSVPRTEKRESQEPNHE